MMPMQVGDELSQTLRMFVDITERRPGALPRHVALAKLKASLARGRLFRGFDQGPPQRQYGQPPLKLDPLATNTARTSLKHYGLLCSEIDDLELSPYPSPLWKSLFSAVPMAMEWVAFLHPMNGNVYKVEDPEYYLDIAYVFTVLLDGLIQPRVGADEKDLADWLVTTRLDVYIVDFWVNLRRYTPDPPKVIATRLLHGMHTLCLALSCPRGTLIPERIGYNLTKITKCNPRRMHRTVMWYAGMICEGADSADMSEQLYTLAYSFLSDVYKTPYSPPSDVVKALLRDIERNIELEAWPVVKSACSYLEQMWTYATSYRIYEVSIAHGAFDVLVRLGKAFPRDPATHGGINRSLFTLSQSFVYWRPVSAFHLKHGPEVIESEEELSALGFGFASFIAVYKERCPLLEPTRAKRQERRRHCRACCTDQGGGGSCCTKPDTTKLLRCGRCRNESYCSPECQRTRWLSGHREICDPLEGWMSARDKEFIGNICTSYLRSNAAAVVADLREVDPDRKHHCMLCVPLVGRRHHVIRLTEECRPGEPRVGAVLGLWDEELKRMTVHVDAISIAELEMLAVEERLRTVPRMEPFDISAHVNDGTEELAAAMASHIQRSSEVVDEQRRAVEMAEQSMHTLQSLLRRH
ncbi:uncharacterized protein SCHCODRAFT_02753339 [Schizophyllum commune H4-8]|uniref:uncharacterized protein n=1 Tax=Schizophyllum commune (strain H4-8 / FGSC 9210) TaxID=578458 RepID=UPI00215F3844|nr:uncharacterized protein SCHCODRAFT_02753339 [Schizophyllum commune H4-8]KAI5886137.1 hypothetical protein SCHCODRAFT_02753339 [Schizophyllum commune H4-8]